MYWAGSIFGTFSNKARLKSSAEAVFVTRAAMLEKLSQKWETFNKDLEVQYLI